MIMPEKLMNTANLVLLTEEDFSSFLDGDVVVRIFHKTTGWFVGMRREKGVTFDGDLCLLHLEPFVQLSITDTTESPNPLHPGETLVSMSTIIKSGLQVDRRPFRLKNPRRLVDNPHDEDLLVIIAENEFAIVSKRPADITAVKNILGSESL